MKITIKFPEYSIFPKKILEYECTPKTKVKEFLLSLLDSVETTDYFDESYINTELLGHFGFINEDFGEQKAQLDYSLLEFLNNFNYDLNNVNMNYYEAYGIGAYVELKEIARIQINGSEKEHNNAHVHITRPEKRFPCFRIDLKTLTEMKNDNPTWETEFKHKERNEILSFLEHNKEKLMDYYNRTTKGEYITEDYTLYYKNKKYTISGNRTY